MSEVPNINIGQMEALVHIKNGKDIHSNELVLIFLNKETSVAAKSLLSQPGVPGNAEDTSKPLREPRNDLCVWRAQGCHSREEIGFFLKNVSVGLTVLTGIAASIGIAATQLPGTYGAGFGRNETTVNAWT